MQLSSLVDYVKELEAWRLDGYDGDDIDYILHLLQHPQLDGRSRSPPGTDNFTMVGGEQARRRNSSWRTPPSTDGNGLAVTWDGRHATATHGSAKEESHNSDIAHALHYASIALLGLLVIEV